MKVLFPCPYCGERTSALLVLERETYLACSKCEQEIMLLPVKRDDFEVVRKYAAGIIDNNKKLEAQSIQAGIKIGHAIGKALFWEEKKT